MPTNYTPNAGNNPATITLPSDLDAATAESVNAALRALGDKSAFAIATRAAIAAVNTFTRGQVFNPSVENEALVATDNFPSDITPDNRWLLLFKFNVESNRTLRLYSGGLSGVGRMAWTLNAHWSVTNQEWELEDDGADAAALIWRSDNFSLYRAPAGADPFASWPTSTDSSGESGSLRCAGEFRYLQPKTRFRTIPLSSCAGRYSINGGSGRVSVETVGTASHIRWPIHLPPGAQIQKIYMMHTITNSAAETFRLARRRPVWDEDTTVPSESWLATAASTTSTGTHITVLEPSAAVVLRDDDLSIVWVPSALEGNAVEGIRIEWLDQGPTPV